MLYYNRIDVFEGIDVNKISESRSARFVTIAIFLNKGFKFQPEACNGCHDLLMMSMNLSDIAILNIKSFNYSCIISRISKSDAINSVQNNNLTQNVEHYKT